MKLIKLYFLAALLMTFNNGCTADQLSDAVTVKASDCQITKNLADIVCLNYVDSYDATTAVIYAANSGTWTL